ILRMVASQDLASAGASSRDSASKARPPAQSSVLWQPKQYFCSVSQCEAGTAWPLATPTAPIMNRVDAVTNRLMTLPPLRMVRGIFLELDATAPAGAAQSATQAAAGLWHHDARLLFAAHFPRLFDGLVQCFLNGSGKFRDRILEAGRFHLEAQWQHATRCEKLGLSAVQHRARGIRLAADEHGHQAPDGAGRTVGEYLFLVEAGRVKADLWQLVLVAHALVYPERLTQRCQHGQVGFQQVVLMQAVEADPAQSLAIQSLGLAIEGRHQPQLDFHSAIGIVVAEHTEWTRRPHLDAQFLAQFARHGIGGCLTRFDLSAWKLPAPLLPLARRPLCNQHLGYGWCRAANQYRSNYAESDPWHCLYLRPEPQGQGSLRPTLGTSRTKGAGDCAPLTGWPRPGNVPAGCSGSDSSAVCSTDWASACCACSCRIRRSRCSACSRSACASSRTSTRESTEAASCFTRSSMLLNRPKASRLNS